MRHLRALDTIEDPEERIDLATEAADKGWSMKETEQIYEQCGMREEALAAVQSAIELGYSIEEIQNWPPLAQLRQDPRFTAFMERKAKEGLNVPTSNK